MPCARHILGFFLENDNDEGQVGGANLAFVIASVDRAREGQPRTASDAVLGGSAEVVKKISAFQTCNALVFVRKRCQNFLQNKSEEKR